MIETPLHLVPLRLLVGKGGEAPRTPVDDVLSPVNQLLLVEADENFPYGLAEPRIQGEAGPVPVTGAAHGLQLVQNGPAGLGYELPGTLHESFPAQILPGFSLLSNESLHHVLRSDAGVVRPRRPESRPTLHPPPSNEDVLDRIVQSVPHVKDRRHVGGRDHDDVGIPALLENRGGLHGETALLHPFGIEAGLDGLGV